MPIDRPAPLDREALKARIAAATPGPWDAIRAPTRRQACAVLALHETSALAYTAAEEFARRQADAEFIAHAREDIPALLAALEAAEAHAAWWQANREQLSTTLGAVIDDRDAENAHLRAALEPLVWTFGHLRPGDEITWTPAMADAVAAGRRALEGP